MGLCHAVHADYAMLCYAASGAFLALAAAVLVRVEPSCSGSGLPEVKATLSGVVLYNSLMLRTLLSAIWCARQHAECTRAPSLPIERPEVTARTRASGLSNKVRSMRLL